MGKIDGVEAEWRLDENGIKDALLVHVRVEASTNEDGVEYDRFRALTVHDTDLAEEMVGHVASWYGVSEADVMWIG